MLKHIVRISLLSFSLVSAACAVPLEGIVLVIADGASQELITATRIASKGVNGHLRMEELPRTAIVKTFSASSLVTDSSAAATAISRGIKADNGVLGMAKADSGSGPPSLLDLARKSGWSTGVVSDDSVTGATPAAFLVEHPSRAQYAQIAHLILPQLGPRADIILGGGTQWFLGETEGLPPEDQRQIRQNSAQLKELPVDHFENWEAFMEWSRTARFDRPVLGLFAPDAFSFHANGDRTLRLLDMVQASVGLLQSRKRPFLLIVEAALPDKACHLNNAKAAMMEVQEFDAVIGWLTDHLTNTLIVATTDHNTGGLALNGYPPEETTDLLKPQPSGTPILTWASGPAGMDAPGDHHLAVLPMASALHTGGDVWLLASGTGSETFHGTLDNTEIFRLIAAAMGAVPD